MSDHLTKNDEMVDMLVLKQAITKATVERAFRSVNRLHFYPKFYNSLVRVLPDNMMAPESSVEVECRALNALDLKPGTKFLHVECGSGYVNAIAGFLVGSTGLNCGIEINEPSRTFGQETMRQFLNNSFLKIIDYGMPEIFRGEHSFPLQLQKLDSQTFDKVFCPREVSAPQMMFLLRLVKVGGAIVMGYERTLTMFERREGNCWNRKALMAILQPPLVSRRTIEHDMPIRDVPTLKSLAISDVRRTIQATTETSLVHAGIYRPLLLDYIKDYPLALSNLFNGNAIFSRPVGNGLFINGIIKTLVGGIIPTRWLKYLNKPNAIPRFTGGSGFVLSQMGDEYLVRGLYLYYFACKDLPPGHRVVTMEPYFIHNISKLPLPSSLIRSMLYSE